MEAVIRSSAAPRSQQMFGVQGQFRADERPRREDRVDVPEVQESTRVSFSEGAAVQATAPARSGLDLYRAVQAL